MVRRQIKLLITLCVLTLVALATLGAVPQQDTGLPPQPFFSDYYSGTVLLQDVPGPISTHLIACINDCETAYQSQPVALTSSGSYDLLEINPSDRLLRGHTVTFYLVNEHGRIKAAETARFEGAYGINTLNLTFDQPMPLPLAQPTPLPLAQATLPPVGDRLVPQVPKVSLILGLATFLAGFLMLLRSRKKLTL